MKRAIAAVLCAVVLAAGCGRADEPAEKEPAQNEQQETGKEEEMQAELDEVPMELPSEDAASMGFYTIANGEVVGGEDAWEAFLQADAEGKEASVVVSIPERAVRFWIMFIASLKAVIWWFLIPQGTNLQRRQTSTARRILPA